MANEEENHALVADKEAPTEFALMAKTSGEFEVFDNSLCSKTCKKNTDSLNSKITELTNKLSDNENMLYHYKLGLSQVEARLVEFKNQEVKYCEKIKGLEFKVESKATRIESLINEIELLKKEKEGLDSKLTGFQTASKDLDSLLKSQRSDKNKKGLGYSVTGASPSNIVSKPFIKFVKAIDSPTENKADKVETVRKTTVKYAELYRKTSKKSNGNSQINIDDKGYWDSGCSRHMTGNISYLSDNEPFEGGYVSFGQGGCKITGKGTIKTSKLEFKNVYFVKDLKYNLFSVSQICDNKNSVMFTDSECIVLGRDFKLIDDTNVLLRTHRQHNKYSIDLNNIVPHKDLTCLVAKASADECMLWHRRLCHLNFKTMNKLVRHNLVRGLPTKCFENDHNCIACLKGKQHKASCKTKLVNSMTKPLHTLHMDLFGPTS
nr:putative ribonuclease H-like domain-containing protein [Tanacetum cinerariifolium]